MPFFFLPIIKQSNPRNEISMISFCVLELEGRSGPLKYFSPFSKVYAIRVYYEAYKIIIADVKCMMRTSFLQSFVSLGNQGDPTEHCVKIGDDAYSRA